MYLGIDFGTTFSKVATVSLSNPLLLFSPGEYGIPSEIYYDKINGMLVGQDALDAGQGTAAANLVSEIKMKLMQNFVLDGKPFSSKQLVSEVYKMLIMKAKQIARVRSISEKIEGIVISVPAKFGMQERALLYTAAKECIPGEVLLITDIIKEPVAAALTYFNTNLEQNKHVLVYDLGGGTCDIALVRANDSLTEHFEVVESDMVRTGGRKWDKVLGDYLADIMEHQYQAVVKGVPGYEEKVRRAAISVKHQLSDPMKTRAIARIEMNGRSISIPVTRKVFDEITAHLLKETLECLQNVYNNHCSTCKIDEIICVGGSSNMLQVEEGIRKMFPKCNVRVYEPEHAVVYGTAIYANLLKGRTGTGGIVKDMANFSYGVECYDNYEKDPSYLIVSNIIKKGDVLPVENKKRFFPVKDNMKSIIFPIYESGYQEETYDRVLPNVRYVGNLELTLPPNTSKNTLLECKIKLNSKGLLEVSAKDQNGKEVKTEFHINNTEKSS